VTVEFNPLTVLLRPVTVVLRAPRVDPCVVMVEFRPDTVVLKPETVVPKAVAVLCMVVSVLLIELKLPARLVTLLMAMGRVAYCDPPEPVVPPPEPEPDPEPWVVVCRTAAIVNAVVLGGTCQVSVHWAVPLLLL